MYILGINSYSHDSGACIIHDNGTELEIVVILESRLNRVKRSLYFPLLSVQYCMDHFGLSDLSEIDLICGIRHQSRWNTDGEMLDNVWLDRAHRGDARRGADFAQQYVLNNAFYRRPDKDIHWVHHMDAHAASAHYVSGFEHSANIAIDAGGVAIYEGRNTLPLRVIDRAGYSGPSIQNGGGSDKRFNRDCLGTLFMNATQALGFSTEGTTMALACFAKEEAGGAAWLKRGTMRKLLGFGELDLTPPVAEADFYMTYSKAIKQVHAYARRNARSLKAFGDTRYDYGQANHKDVLRPAVDIAYKVQTMLEQEMIRLVRLAKEKVNAPNLCISGGIGLSCVTNRIIYELDIFDDIFIQPAASDEGLAFGAALHGYYSVKNGTRRHHMTRSYFGHPYPPESVEAAAGAVGLKGKKSTPAEVAKLIANGKIIGRFGGRSEFGPRALGNRSILADPRDAGAARKINEVIKQREWFRPFAPACALESCNDYFDMPIPGPFMIIAAPMRQGYEEQKLAAVRHVDNSTRPQTVTAEQNPTYYALITEFGKLTGYSVLLNTSFNSKSEPIVETPEEAFLTAIEIGLDYLYIEDMLFEMPDDAVLRESVKARRKAKDVNTLQAYEALKTVLCSEELIEKYSSRVSADLMPRSGNSKMSK